MQKNFESDKMLKFRPMRPLLMFKTLYSFTRFGLACYFQNAFQRYENKIYYTVLTALIRLWIVSYIWSLISTNNVK
jgi:hypothetical protein